MNVNSGNLYNKHDTAIRKVNNVNNRLNSINYSNNIKTNSSVISNQQYLLKEKNSFNDLHEIEQGEKRNSKENRDNRDTNLKGRLEDAYSDLENLKKAIQDIKSSNNNMKANAHKNNKHRTTFSFHQMPDSPIEINPNQTFTKQNYPHNNLIDRDEYFMTPPRAGVGSININNEYSQTNNFRHQTQNLINPLTTLNSNDSFNIKNPGLLENDDMRTNSVDVINNFKEVLKESERFTTN